MPHIYSTLTADVNYHVYHEPTVKSSQEPRRVKKTILIKGGSGVAPAGKRRLPTPFGVVTEVTAEELAILEKDETFNVHLKNGFVSISDKKVDPEVVAADMELRDDSSPIMPEDGMKGDVNNAGSDSGDFDTEIKIPKKERSNKVVNNVK